MSMLVHLAPCGHMQELLEIGEFPSPGMTWTTYPVDDDPANAIVRGDAMTCVTCDQIRTVVSAQQ